ncbi:hypothetical protein POEJIIAE_00025 [Mannheimia haemolytica]
MLPELGYFSLLLAAISAIFQVGFALLGEVRKQYHWLALAPLFTYLQAAFTTFSFSTLAYAFLTDDFSVIYVAAHSNSQLPDFLNLPPLGADTKAQCCFGSPLL